jgi:cell wall-associated NlpC family hydrolase
LTRGELVAAEAREWLGTKFIWQASCKGVGCDCKGLLWGVARELGFPEAESLYAQVSNYSAERPVPSALLKEGFADIFDPVDAEPFREWLRRTPKDAGYKDPAPLRLGDVLLLKIGGKASHIAIVSADDRAIHAQIGSKDWVKEASLRSLLKMFPLDSAWRWREDG